MNPTVKRLCEIGQQNTRTILGLMSGTSLDGLDLAVCRISGSGKETELSLTHFTTVPYEDDFRDMIREVFAKKTVDFELLTLLNAHVARVHSRMILTALEAWTIPPDGIDLIASHGQTVYHAPKHQHLRPEFPNATLQIGDGDHLAVMTGIITISDFRQKHIAAGGEGAPLALYGDVLLFTHPHEDRVMINLGGIANFTWLPHAGSGLASLVTDSGPGNTLLDAAMRRYFNSPFDDHGIIARSGHLDQSLLIKLLEHPYFQAPVPKTTGPEVFNLAYLDACLADLPSKPPPADQIATLTYFTDISLTDCIKNEVPDWITAKYYARGGGAENPELMRLIAVGLPGCEVEKIEKLGIPSGAKEAVLFAVLANESVAGGQTDFSPHPSVCTGKISLPK